MKPTPTTARELAEAYRKQFGFQLRGRLATLLHRHPNVRAPEFVSWEGESLTGADTTEKLRALYRKTPWV